jgi:PST family polysaccharide transporter
LFWLCVASGFALALLLALSAPLVAWFFGDARLVGLTIASAGVVLLGSSQSQHLALLNRDMRFKAIAGIDALSITVASLTGITLAWLTSSYWALFAVGLSSVLTSLACAWALSDFRPGRPSWGVDLREIIRFGSGVSGFNLVNYFARNADKLLIGRYWGSGDLAFYDRAYRLLLFPLEQVRNPLARVMLPVLSRLQYDAARYRRAYADCVSLMLLVTQPGLVFACVFSNEVFEFLLGPRWLPAAPIFQWLGICALHQVMTTTVAWLFLSQGRGGEYFRLGAISAVTTVASFLAGLPWGPMGVAIAYTVTDYALRLPLSFWSAARRGPVSLRDLSRIALPHTAATCASAAMLVAAATISPFGANTFLALLPLSYAVYGCVLMGFPAKQLAMRESLRSCSGAAAGLGELAPAPWIEPSTEPRPATLVAAGTEMRAEISPARIEP